MTLFELIPDSTMQTPDIHPMVESCKDDVKRALVKSLSPEQYKVITLHYGIGYTYPMPLKSIADEFGFTLEGVRQIREKALQRLRRTPAVVKLLKQHLG